MVLGFAFSDFSAQPPLPLGRGSQELPPSPTPSHPQLKMVSQNIGRGFNNWKLIKSASVFLASSSKEENMLSIRSPTRQEIIEALVRYQNGEELTDRELWILEEYEEEETDEFELFE